jgi:hypothetical protein
MASAAEEVQSLVVKGGENCRQLRGEGLGEGQGCGVLENLRNSWAKRFDASTVPRSILIIELCTLIPS